MFLSWFRGLTTRTPGPASRRRPARRPERTRCLSLEALEDRVLLNATDLAITLTSSPATILPPSLLAPGATVFPGSLLTYTLAVQNNGPQDTSGSPTVTDQLPADFQFIAATADTGTVSFANGTVTALPGVLANGARATVTILTTPRVGGILSNTAMVAPASGDTDSMPDNNSQTDMADITKTPTTPADLLVTATSSARSAVVPGQPITYTFTVTNRSAATPATLTELFDQLPAGATFVSATTSQGTVSEGNGRVTADLGTVSNGTPATVTVTVTPTATGTLSNTATATNDAGATAIANLTPAAIQTTVNAVPSTAANLQVSQTPSPTGVLPGQPFTYTLTVSNSSTNAATGTLLGDQLPVHFIFISATSSQGTVTQSGSVVTANLGTIPNGTPATVTILGTFTGPGTYTNTAVAATTAGNVMPGNNSSTSMVTVGAPPSPSAEIAVVLTGPTTAALGQTVTYTTNVYNQSTTSQAAGTVLTLSLPAGFTFVSASASQGTITQANGVVTVNLGTVTHAGIDVMATPTATGSASVMATATTTAGEFFVLNNTATATTTVSQAAVQVVLTASPTRPIPGQALTLTATVTPQGGTTAIPAGSVTFFDGTTSLGSGTLNSSGVATLPLPQGLPAGIHVLTAAFPGDATFAANTSAVVNLNVQAATMTTLTSSQNPSTPGQAVTFTATVTPTGGATGTPTGQVSFLSSTVLLGTATLNANGQATFTTSSLPVGATQVTASYGGTTAFAGSLSAALTQTVSSTTPVGPGNTGYVTQLYADLLGRAPDQAGLQFWVNLLNTNQLTRTDVAFQFEQSMEYRLRMLNQQYQQFLGRALDPTGQDTWLNFLSGGGTFEQVEERVLASPEYFQSRGGGTVNGYVSAVYRDVLHRAPDAGGQSAFSAALNAGLDRLTLTAFFLTSPESDTLEVQSMFQQFLRRAPDASGATTFFTALQAGVSNETAISIILGSPEYFAKFTT
jgi:uncharacterized repeat protein (TIGR01451 family)